MRARARMARAVAALAAAIRALSTLAAAICALPTLAVATLALAAPAAAMLAPDRAILALSAPARAILTPTAPALPPVHPIAGIVPDVPTGTHLRHRTAQMGGLQYEGGPVLHSNRTHLIFWQPAGSGLRFQARYQTLMERFLAEVAAASHRAANVYALSGQYHDDGGPAAYASTYGGAVIAADRLPARQCREPSTAPSHWSDCVTDAQLQQELERVVASDRLPRSSSDIYFILLPDRLGSCTDTTSQICALGGTVSGYCGYHSVAADGLLYAFIPYNAVPGHCQSGNPRPNASAADPAISTISHEHLESITDPDAFASWIDANGNEIGDLCVTKFGRALGGSGSARFNEQIAGGRYWLQEEWSNEDNSCQPRAHPDQVSLSVPGRTTAGQPLSLTGHARARHGRIVAYAWSFGDGTSSPRAVTTHAFARRGNYRVVLKVTDSATLWSFATATIQVVPAAAPAARDEHGDQLVKPH